MIEFDKIETGVYMNEPKQTQRLDLDESLLLEALNKRQALDENTDLGEVKFSKAREVLLLTDSGLRRIELRNDTSYLLGRFNSTKPRSNHIDLVPFGAQERGVSRIHAQIHMEDDVLYITDMESTNGTYLDGVRLLPNQQHRIRQKSDILLGRLHIQVMYKSAQEVAEIK